MDDISLLVGNGIPGSSTLWLTAPKPLMESELQLKKYVQSAVLIAAMWEACRKSVSDFRGIISPRENDTTANTVRCCLLTFHRAKINKNISASSKIPIVIPILD